MAAHVTDHESAARHRHTTRLSFEKQAEEFSRSPMMTDPVALARLVEWADVTGGERVLDVACGPGLVAAAFAPKVRSVVGIDLTSGMLVRGREIACERGAANVAFVQADVTALPFPDNSFDRVTSRRAFHHFPEPECVLAEMARVCRAAGALVIEDQAPPPESAAAEAMTTIDRLRDPSHTQAVDPEAWPAMLEACGLTLDRIDIQPRELDVDEWLTRAHPAPADAAQAREMLEAAARHEIPGLRVRYASDELRNTLRPLRLTIGLQILRAVHGKTSAIAGRRR